MKKNGDSRTFKFDIKNCRVKIYIDDLLHLSFDQLSYLGLYSYREDTKWYGIDIYLKDQVITVEYETRQTWEEVLKLIDKNL